MLEPLTNAQIRKFKAAAQLMEPMLKVGKAGLSDGFIRTVSQALDQHELVKIKFAEFKEQKKELAPVAGGKDGEPFGDAGGERDGAAPAQGGGGSTTDGHG